MVVSEILIFICAFFAAKHFWDKRRFYYLATKIPNSGFDFSLKGLYNYFTADTKQMYKIINESVNNGNEVTKTLFGPNLFVIAFNPDDMKIIFNAKECYDKPYFMKFAELYKGTLFGDLDYWRSHRKIMNPFFGVNGLKSVIPIFNEKTKIMIKSVGKMVGKGEFNVFHYISAQALETVLKVMEYDVDIQNKQPNERDSYIKNLEIFLRILTLRMFIAWQHPNFIFKKLSNYQQQNIAAKNTALKFTHEIIKNARNMINNNEAEKPKSFMEAMVSPRNNFTDEEISDEVKTVIMAAEDTSAIASSTTLLMLAMHKDVQEKVVAELYEVFGKTTEAPYIDIDKLNELKYLEMVINESIRLYPVVPMVFRHVGEEIVLSEGYRIPAKTNIAVPINKIHRNEKYWGDDAQEFKPERFEKENFKKIHPYAFIPYTKGPRMCLGYRYATYLMKIQLANFLLRYELDTTLKKDELEFWIQVTMSVCQGYKISIKNRQCKSID